MVTIRNEKRRGCGYRKQGGLYLVAGGPEAPCGKLPLPLEVCPTCGQGIKPARGWTWVDAKELFAGVLCQDGDYPRPLGAHCTDCPLDELQLELHPRMGLLWVGEQFYPTPAEFLQEGIAQGICRRLHAIPKDFVIGETWVLVAHRKAIDINPKDLQEGNNDQEPVGRPGIFSCFLPREIQYVVKPDDSDEKLKDLEKRGIRPVRLVWDQDENGNQLLEENDRPFEEEGE
jgi:hypothetical protein